jgi:hypothetical protein
MAEYIEKEAALNLILETPFTMSMCLSELECHGMNRAKQIFARLLEQEPAADVRENVKGEWISPDGISICSNCGKAAPYDVEGDIIMYWPNLNFCPNCGAKMGGAEDG